MMRFWVKSCMTSCFFFFQAEDGIRDVAVTGVQTCALPISSDYMRAMYYASQPMEADNFRALACTFEMINAETQLLYASDYPHWDFDVPSRLWVPAFAGEERTRIGVALSIRFKLKLPLSSVIVAQAFSLSRQECPPTKLKPPSAPYSARCFWRCGSPRSIRPWSRPRCRPWSAISAA